MERYLDIGMSRMNIPNVKVYLSYPRHILWSGDEKYNQKSWWSEVNSYQTVAKNWKIKSVYHEKFEYFGQKFQKFSPTAAIGGRRRKIFRTWVGVLGIDGIILRGACYYPVSGYPVPKKPDRIPECQKSRKNRIPDTGCIPDTYKWFLLVSQLGHTE